MHLSNLLNHGVPQILLIPSTKLTNTRREAANVEVGSDMYDSAISSGIPLVLNLGDRPATSINRAQEMAVNNICDGVQKAHVHGDKGNASLTEENYFEFEYLSSHYRT